MNCPDCGAAAPAGARLCPACGFPLVLSPTELDGGPVPLDLLRKPEDTATRTQRGPAASAPPGAPLPPSAHPRPAGVRAPATRLPTMVAGSTGWPGSAAGIPAGAPASVNPQACRQCAHVSSPQRVRCEHCGAVLPERRPEFPGPVAARPVPARRRRPRWPWIAGGVAIAAAAIGGGLYAGLHDPAPPPAAGDQVSTDEPVPQAVDRRTIRVSASSTLHPDQDRYRAANTIDGSAGTAWNNDGTKDGTGKGVVLTYRFDRPRHLVQITLMNGFVRSSREQDVWSHNGRLRKVRLTTDTGTRDVVLTDTPKPQSLPADLGTTRRLSITILSVYPGTEHPDVALTEIAFKALPA